LGAAAGFLASVFGFAGAFAFFSVGFDSVSGFALATFGDVGFFGLGAAGVFFTAAFVFATAAETAAVADLVASRGDLRVGPVAAFFAGMMAVEGDSDD
jgi:hypothetical protein